VGISYCTQCTTLLDHSSNTPTTHESTDGLAATARPPSWLLSPAGSTSSTTNRLRTARSALKALEAAALGSGSSSSSGSGTCGGRLTGGGTAASAALAPLAAWLLATTSAAAAAGSMGGSSSSGASAGERGGVSGGATAAGGVLAAPPLSAYPEGGALRPLAERLLMPNSGEESGAAAAAAAADAGPPLVAPPAATFGDGSVPASVPPGPVEAASLLRVLAAAPRLPAAGWEAVCRRLLLRPAAATAAGWQHETAVPLRLAALDLVLSHAHVTALGLTSLLDHALMPTAFAQLPVACRALLLRRIPDAVRCLPANRAGPLLQGLASLVPEAGSGGGGASAAGSEVGVLQVAAWEGLRGLCGCLAGKDAAIISKVRFEQGLGGGAWMAPLVLQTAGLCLVGSVTCNAHPSHYDSHPQYYAHTTVNREWSSPC